MPAGGAASGSSFLSASSFFAGAAEPFHLAAQDNTGRAEDLGVASKGLATDPRNAMRIAIVTRSALAVQAYSSVCERERSGAKKDAAVLVLASFAKAGVFDHAN